MATKSAVVICKLTASDREWVEAEAELMTEQKGKRCTLSEVLRAALAEYRLNRDRRHRHWRKVGKR